MAGFEPRRDVLASLRASSLIRIPTRRFAPCARYTGVAGFEPAVEGLGTPRPSPLGHTPKGPNERRLQRSYASTGVQTEKCSTITSGFRRRFGRLGRVHGGRIGPFCSVVVAHLLELFLDFVSSALEFAHSLTRRPSELRNLVRPEQQHEDEQHDEELRPTRDPRE